MKDQKLIVDLLMGRTVYDPRDLPRQQYLKEGSAEEKEARRALARELRRFHRPLELALRDRLAALIDPDADTDQRRIRFAYRGKGNRSNAMAEKKVAQFMWGLDQNGEKLEAILSKVKQKFGKRRSRAIEIWKAWEPHFYRLEHRRKNPGRAFTPADWLTRRQRKMLGQIGD